MHRLPHTLINTARIELWPAWLLQARSNHDARRIAGAHWVLRRKHDGRYVAAASRHALTGLMHDWQQQPGMEAARDQLATLRHDRPWVPSSPFSLAVDGLQPRLEALGLDAHAYAEHTGLPLVPEPSRLALAGFDRYRRPLWLQHDAARAWRRMQGAAGREGILLDAISGYRSHDYQMGIFARKRARGQTVEEILAVNAAPGFSEHHGGCALDIGTPGEPPAEDSFEHTAAFAWLSAHAGDFGFRLSYPRNNPHGIVYEPWHWRWHRSGDLPVS